MDKLSLREVAQVTGAEVNSDAEILFEVVFFSEAGNVAVLDLYKSGLRSCNFTIWRDEPEEIYFFRFWGQCIC